MATSSLARQVRLAVALGAFAACALASAADTGKTLRVAFAASETGFDPAASSDLYSNTINRAIFDPLYAYDYLARPFRIVPNTAQALPTISADGLRWTIKVRPGIYFADDPAFKGRKRELTAADYVYSWKRLMDPKVRSPHLEAVNDRFVGEDGLLGAARASGKLDYDMPFEGLRAVDRYTIEIRLKQPDYDLLPDLASSVMSAVAREVVEAYGDESRRVMAHPVGTGPYVLKEWRRSQRIVLEASPTFREVRFPESDAPEDRAIVAQMKGKRLPAIGRVEVSIIEESNPRLLAFEQKQLDVSNPVPPDLIWNVLEDGTRLKRSLAEQGVVLVRDVQPSITFEYFNMDDPVVGGYTRERIALRRAISMAYNVDDEIRVVRQGQAIPATQPIAPHMAGHDPGFNGSGKYDPALARALLDRFGYVDRDGDGWRERPDGSPLTLTIASRPTSLDRQLDEVWKRSLTAVGIRTEFYHQNFADLLKQARAGQLQVWGLGNISSSPEGFGVMGLLAGKNKGLSNFSRFDLPEFNELYEQGRRMPNGPERDKLIRRMSEMVALYAPWRLQVYRFDNVLVQPWLVGFKYTPFNANPWLYWDIDLDRRRQAGI